MVRLFYISIVIFPQFFGTSLIRNGVFGLKASIDILSALSLAIYNTYVAKWQIDNLGNERHCLIALSWQPDRFVLL